MHKNLQILYYEHVPCPYAIRDSGGLLFSFMPITKYEGQDERYEKEVAELCDLANYLLEALKKRTPPIAIPISNNYRLSKENKNEYTPKCSQSTVKSPDLCRKSTAKESLGIQRCSRDYRSRWEGRCLDY